MTLFKYTSVHENRPSKMKFFGIKEFFFVNLEKMSVKMNFRIITTNHAADSKIRPP